MYIARTNVTIPDRLLDRARAEGLNVSGVASAALEEELDRREKIAALRRYLDELDVEQGPIPVDERTAAREWADRELGGVRRSGGDPAELSTP